MNFAQFLLAHEPVMRLSSFVLTPLAVAERMWPARGITGLARRQGANLGLMAVASAASCSPSGTGRLAVVGAVRCVRSAPYRWGWMRPVIPFSSRLPRCCCKRSDAFHRRRQPVPLPLRSPGMHAGWPLPSHNDFAEMAPDLAETSQPCWT